jgi:hypothetical protein
MRVYLDSMVWIYGFEANSHLAVPARKFFKDIEDSATRSSLVTFCWLNF